MIPTECILIWHHDQVEKNCKLNCCKTETICINLSKEPNIAYCVFWDGFNNSSYPIPLGHDVFLTLHGRAMFFPLDSGNILVNALTNRVWLRDAVWFLRFNYKYACPAVLRTQPCFEKAQKRPRGEVTGRCLADGPPEVQLTANINYWTCEYRCLEMNQQLSYPVLRHQTLRGDKLFLLYPLWTFG